jgi:DNA-binding MarR family transcriptional regulator
MLDDVVFMLGRTYFNYVGLMERVLREQKVEDVFAPGMGQIMFALYEGDDRIIKEISERVGLSQSTLTGMLTRMEKNGLIERRRDSIDGRAIRVRLTAKGRELEPKCWAIFQQMREQFRKALSEAELGQLRNSLGKLANSLRAGIAEEMSP